MLFTIITPTTGHPKLVQLLESVNTQIYAEDIQIEHFIVVDGPKFKNATDNILLTVPANTDFVSRFLFYLPFNTGAGGYLGHKIYASISQLVRGDYVLFIDDDNWLEPQHIMSFHKTLTSVSPPLEWCYSLRQIVSPDGDYICRDDCESLGFLHPIFYSPNGLEHMIDTNCTCVSRELVIRYSTIWNRVNTNTSDDPDRLYSQTLMQYNPRYDCTYRYTINYRVANRQGSVSSELFLVGNQRIAARFSGKIPWSDSRPRLVIAHFDPQHTAQLISRVYQPREERECVAYNQWQLNLLDDFSDYFLMNAYQRYIPAGSKVLVHMCDPNMLPPYLAERTDIEKILYTAEGPNIRHQAQWSADFLRKHFTTVLTYWDMPQCRNMMRVVHTPFVHRLDFKSATDMDKCMRTNKADPKTKTICIVLENRPFSGKYQVQGTDLYSLDYLRCEYALRLGKRISCYGSTWEPHKSVVQYCPAKSRFLDEEWTIDIMQKYTFVLIIENCTADGYVSEKIYDALAAGCIPLYYGNNNAEIGVPTDCYVDLKQIPPHMLPEWIDNLSYEEMDTYLRSILEKRREVLAKVSVNSYNAKIKSILQK